MARTKTDAVDDDETGEMSVAEGEVQGVCVARCRLRHIVSRNLKLLVPLKTSYIRGNFCFALKDALLRSIEIRPMFTCHHPVV